MISENDILLVLALLSFVLLVYILIQELSKQKLKQKIFKLEHNLKDALQKEKIETSSTKPLQQNPNTLEYIKKIEALEAELYLQKKRVLETKAIAQEANRVKSEFLSNIRHEIRTPMNSIMVFTDLLSQESLDAKLQSYVKNIAVSGKKLLSLLDNIIELSSVEGGTFDIEETPVDIRELIDTIVTSKRAQAEKKGLQVIVEISDRVPDTLLLDKEKVEEILINLIDNAIKFTDKGFVKITLDVDKKNILKNVVNLTFSIKDSGVGIEEQYLERIFEIFEKPDSDDEKIRGAGLGLSINRKLARAMHGDIRVTSKVDEGSTFEFVLQNVEVALASANTSEFDEQIIDFSLIKTRYNQIVVIDSDEESCNTIREAFANTAIKVVVFEDPRKAIHFLRNESVDVIFIDVNILTDDDNAVAKILIKVSAAAIVTITSSRLKHIDFISDLKLVGHIMRPISVAELFKTTLKAVSFKEPLSMKKETTKQKQDLCMHLDTQQKEKFLFAIENHLETLYEEAYKTNDLESIRVFATALYETAKEHKVYEFEEFANILLEKIELFDIDAMHSMMQVYKEKITILKNL